jgi:hypothetical protein
MNSAIEEVIQKKWKMQTWAKDIKRLGIPEDGFRQHPRNRLHIAQAGPLVDVFENLEERVYSTGHFLAVLPSWPGDVEMAIICGATCQGNGLATRRYGQRCLSDAAAVSDVW